MTTEARPMHWMGDKSCGAITAAGLSETNMRDRVTCPACLTAMGGGRVVSGLDAVAATPGRPKEAAALPRNLLEMAQHGITLGPPPPASPSRVEVGVKPTTVAVGQQRWLWYGVGQYEYLGTVPAPVSAPGQSTPVETPPKPCTCVGDNDEDECQCEPCGCKERGAPHPPAAPAPGVGEGRPSWPFSVKLESIASPDSAQSVVRSLPALAQRLGLTVDVEINGVATFVVPGDTPDDADARWKSRAKKPPEPLPAPVPRVSRVQMLRAELEQEDFDAPTRADVDRLCERVVEETLKAVRATYNPLEDVAKTLDRARTAMLEPKS